MINNFFQTYSFNCFSFNEADELFLSKKLFEFASNNSRLNESSRSTDRFAASKLISCNC